MTEHVQRAWIALAPVVLLAACGPGRPDYSPARTPPQVQLATAPPQYTSSPFVTLSIVATAVQGVKAVHALCGAVETDATREADGTWQVTVQLGVVGMNTIAIWADDTASPTPNSGRGMDPPYQIVVEVIYDPTPPSVTYDASYASYTDERNVQLLVDANGAAVLPAAYSIGPKYGIPLGGDIYKASSRISGGAMTAAELETTNAGNIPVLRFNVPFDVNTSAPIETPSYVAQVACPSPCPDFPDATGELLASATPSDEYAFFDLPLAVETIPALAQVQGPATISITLTVSDAAGNTSVVPGFDFTFHVIGPPVAIAEDLSYPSAANPESTYAYHLADDTYALLWAGATQLTNYEVRLLRYVITNPTAQPVALELTYTQDPSGSWQAVETWNAFGAPEPTGSGVALDAPYQSKTYVIDGFTYRNPMFWELPYGSTGGILGSIGEEGPSPCAHSDSNVITHVLGDESDKYTCWPPPADLQLPQTDTCSSGDVSTLAYRIAPELGGEEEAPNTDASGQWLLVPAATPDAPGALVVYLTRPVNAARTPPLAWNAVTSDATNAAAAHYQVWLFEAWYDAGQDFVGYETYSAYREGGYLESAEDQLYGGLQGSTMPYGDSGVFGEEAARVDVALSCAPLFVH